MKQVKSSQSVNETLLTNHRQSKMLTVTQSRIFRDDSTTVESTCGDSVPYCTARGTKHRVLTNNGEPQSV